MHAKITVTRSQEMLPKHCTQKNCIQFSEWQSDSGRKLRLPTQLTVLKLAVCGQLCNKNGKNASNDEKTFSGSAETESLYNITGTANKIRKNNPLELAEKYNTLNSRHTQTRNVQAYAKIWPTCSKVLFQNLLHNTEKTVRSSKVEV